MTRVAKKWPADISGARTLQERHRNRVRVAPLEREPGFVAGVDAAFSDDKIFAAACVFQYPDLVCIEQATAIRESSFPYVPGYLIFREGPAIIAAVNKLNVKPDLILIDAHGIAHPRGVGSASHLGLLLDIPTIGCAKTRLIGEYREPGAKTGNWAPLKFEGKTVGAVLRTRNSVRPLFVSPGHKIDLDAAVRIILACLGTFRVPEPIRCADMLSRKLRTEYAQSAVKFSPPPRPPSPGS